MTTATPPVFIYDDAAALALLKPGDTFELTGKEGKHALVQRLNNGELLDVVDGKGLRVRCQVIEPISNGLQLEVLCPMKEPLPAVTITLVQALAKNDRAELAIETAVEVGVDAIVPWQADRSIVQWRGEKAVKAKAKWEDAVRAAAKQARRAFVPPVADLVNSKTLAKQIEDIGQSGGEVWVLDAAGKVTATAAGLANSSYGAEPQGPESTSHNGTKLLIIVVPEGGISPAEINAFQQAGARLVRLGPHIMRTSTAGPIAVSRAAEQLGRWQ